MGSPDPASSLCLGILKGIACSLCKRKERFGVGHGPRPGEAPETGMVCRPSRGEPAISFSPFPDACLPPRFFHSFVHTFLKYLPNTYFRHTPGLARAGVYRRRLFSPLPLNGSSLLLSPHNSVVTGVDGGISKIHPCRRYLCQEFPATPKESGRLMALSLGLTRGWREVAAAAGGGWKEACSQAVCPSLFYSSHLSGPCSVPGPIRAVSHTSFNPPDHKVFVTTGPVLDEETEARKGK